MKNFICFLLMWGGMVSITFAQLTADFTHTNVSCAIQFTDQSTGNPTSWTWDFGDGNSSTQQNPIHGYSVGGTYAVTLTVQNASGSDFISKNVTSQVMTVTIDTMRVTGGCALQLTPVTSSPSPISYQWSTGDTTQVIFVRFSGTYSVLVTDQSGCTGFASINVIFTAAQLNVQIQVVTGLNCVDTLVVFPPGLASYIWSNGSQGRKFLATQQGAYVVFGTNASGCTGTDTLVYTPRIISPNATLTHPTCDNISNGAISLAPTSSAGGPYSYLWSNGQTSSTVAGLSVGTHFVDISNSNCTARHTFVLQSGRLGLTTSSQRAGCDSLGGSASVVPSGVTPPYSYSWTNGANTQTATNLRVGGYAVYVTDGTGCVNHRPVWVEVADTCRSNVRGRVFHDVNKNCVRDPGEPGIPGIIVFGNGVAFSSDSTGMYLFQTGFSTPQAIAVAVNTHCYPLFHSLCPSSGSHIIPITSANFDTSGVDFAFQVDSALNLGVDNWANALRPGFPSYLLVSAVNHGISHPGPVQVKLKLDPLLDVLLVHTAPYQYDTTNHEITWDIGPLGIGKSKMFGVGVIIPPTVQLGTPITNISTILPIAGDSFPENNVDTLVTVVTGSYDPNDKQVEPAGIGPEGFIPSSVIELLYTIRFQNTGTDTAFIVQIRDTIDPHIDATTFVPVNVSHPFEMHVEKDSVLVFTFDNILLPDSNVNEPESHGHIRFTLMLRDSIPEGTRIDNRAAIYFDFNAPIITNTVVNTVSDVMTLCDCPPEAGLRLAVYPNPASHTITIESLDGLNTLREIQLFDPKGRLLEERVIPGGQQRYRMDLYGHPSGLYLIRVQTDLGPVNQKIVLAK